VSTSGAASGRPCSPAGGVAALNPRLHASTPLGSAGGRDGERSEPDRGHPKQATPGKGQGSLRKRVCGLGTLGVRSLLECVHDSLEIVVRVETDQDLAAVLGFHLDLDPNGKPLPQIVLDALHMGRFLDRLALRCGLGLH
jgi:hypothetical protein